MFHSRAAYNFNLGLALVGGVFDSCISFLRGLPPFELEADSTLFNSGNEYLDTILEEVSSGIFEMILDMYE